MGLGPKEEKGDYFNSRLNKANCKHTEEDLTHPDPPESSRSGSPNPGMSLDQLMSPVGEKRKKNVTKHTDSHFSVTTRNKILNPVVKLQFQKSGRGRLTSDLIWTRIEIHSVHSIHFVFYVIRGMSEPFSPISFIQVLVFFNTSSLLRFLFILCKCFSIITEKSWNSELIFTCCGSTEQKEKNSDLHSVRHPDVSSSSCSSSGECDRLCSRWSHLLKSAAGVAALQQELLWKTVVQNQTSWDKQRD